MVVLVLFSVTKSVFFGPYASMAYLLSTRVPVLEYTHACTSRGTRVRTQCTRVRTRVPVHVYVPGRKMSGKCQENDRGNTWYGHIDFSILVLEYYGYCNTYNKVLE